MVALLNLLTPVIISDSTSDGMRIFILNFVLVVLNEGFGIVTRFYVRFTDRVVINTQQNAFLIEMLIQFYRRILVI